MMPHFGGVCKDDWTSENLQSRFALEIYPSKENSTDFACNTCVKTLLKKWTFQIHEAHHGNQYSSLLNNQYQRKYLVDGKVELPKAKREKRMYCVIILMICTKMFFHFRIWSKIEYTITAFFRHFLLGLGFITFTTTLPPRVNPTPFFSDKKYFWTAYNNPTQFQP